MKTWLVTGGAGFIGANFVRLAAERELARIVILDALTYAGDLGRLEGVVDGASVLFEDCDIADAAAVAAILDRHRPDAIVHMAAESHVDRSILGAEPFIRTNIHGTHVLLEEARAAWGADTQGRMFLHVSTDEVFGSLSPSDPPFTEDSPYRPSSPYSASKASSDHLVHAWHVTFGLPTVITNCSNNYGPWQFPEKLIPLMIVNAVEGKSLPVYGDGMQVRDWLHVEDHCQALFRVLEAAPPGSRYNIGGNCERPNLRIVEAVCDAVDAELGRPHGTARRSIEHVVDRPGHDRRYAIDSSRLQRELGWGPSRQVDADIGDLVRWYMSHQAWVDRVRSGEYQDFYRRQYGTGGV